MRDIAPFRAAAVGRHAAPVLAVYAGPMAVALDFDGVLVDSEPELSRVAWRTSCRLWPALTDECAIVDHLMDESAYKDRRRLGGQGGKKVPSCCACLGDYEKGKVKP